MMMMLMMFVIDNRVLQQFAQDTVQGGSNPVPSIAAKNTPDSNLVCALNIC